MISSKDVPALQRLTCSLDILFLLGILLRNSVVAALEFVSLGLLEYFDLYHQFI